MAQDHVTDMMVFRIATYAAFNGYINIMELIFKVHIAEWLQTY